MSRSGNVASFTDAWIETLKEIQKAETEIVASFTDAWIETNGRFYVTDKEESHLLQMRGLKHADRHAP